MKDPPVVVGHRGWPARFPDNTLAGFLAAATVADAVETDIRRSADGKLVLSHDPVLGGLDVADHPWSVLGELDLGDGHRPALLDEAIAAIPGTSFQFEVKNQPHEPGFEPDHRLALETAARARPGDMVTSFNWDTLAALRRVFPEVTTGVLVGDSGDIDQAINECFDVGHPALVPSIQLSITDLVRSLETGLQVFPWVVNDSGRAGELAGLGVWGIITDDPGVVSSALGRDR
ncbi:MAG: glycerophosphodiester phosphodiesterase [Acidimicrobiia bacterium]